MGRSNFHKIHPHGPNSYAVIIVSTRTIAAVFVFRMDDGTPVSSGERDHQLLSDFEPENDVDDSDVPVEVAGAAPMLCIQTCVQR